MWLSTIYVVFLLFLHESGVNLQELNPPVVSFGQYQPAPIRSALGPNPQLPIINSNERTDTSKNRKKLRYSVWYNKALETPSKEENTSYENGFLKHHRENNNETAVQNPSQDILYNQNIEYTTQPRPPLSIQNADIPEKDDIEPIDTEYNKGYQGNANIYPKTEHAAGYINPPNDNYENINPYNNSSESFRNMNNNKSGLAFKSGNFRHQRLKKTKTEQFSKDSVEGSVNNRNHKIPYFGRKKTHSHKNASAIKKNNSSRKNYKHLHKYQLKKKNSYSNSSKQSGTLVTDNSSVDQLKKDFQTHLANNSTEQPTSSNHLHNYKTETNNKTILSQNLDNFMKRNFIKISRIDQIPYSSKVVPKKHIHIKNIHKTLSKHKKTNYKKKTSKKLHKHKDSSRTLKRKTLHNKSLRKFKKKTNHASIKNKHFHRSHSPKSKKHYLHNNSTHKNAHKKNSRKHKGNIRNIARKKLKKEKILGHDDKSSIIQPFRKKKLKNRPYDKEALKKSKDPSSSKLDKKVKKLSKSLQRKYSLLKSMETIKNILINAGEENDLISKGATIDVVNGTYDPLVLPITMPSVIQSKDTTISVGITERTPASTSATVDASRTVSVTRTETTLENSG